MSETWNPSQEGQHDRLWKSKTRKEKRGGWIPFLIGCGGLVLLTLVVGGVFLYAGWLGYQEAPKLVEEVDPSVSPPDRFGYSAQQEQTLAENGLPESFTILFFQEEAVDASLLDVRLETWRYYHLGKELTFINGILQEEETVEARDPGTLSPLPYTLDQFTAYLSLEEVLSTAGLESYLEVPLENEYLDEGQLYYGQALTFGLKDDELRYI